MTSIIILIFILILFWAFFSGAETAFISSDRLKLRKMEKEGSRRAKIALFLIEKPERILTTVLIGTNLSLVLAANLTAKLFYQIYGKPRPISSIITITVLSLFLCEVLPKNLAFKNNIKFTLLSSYPLMFFYILFYPVILVLSVVTRIFIKIVGIEYTGLIPSIFKEKEDVRIFFQVSIGKQFDREKTRYFVDSLDFGTKILADIQIPLVDIKAIKYESSIGDAVNFIKKYHKSVIPVYKSRIDDIVGVVMPRSILNQQKDRPVSEVMDDPKFVPETKSINDLYREMFENDIAVVFGVDEHGGVTGLATIYDIGEEIIGKISSLEEKKNLIVKISPTEYLVDGDVEIDELNHLLAIDLEAEGVNTLNGLVTKVLGRIPEKGSTIKLKNCIITVEKSSKKRAELLRVKRIPGN